MSKCSSILSFKVLKFFFPYYLTYFFVTHKFIYNTVRRNNWRSAISIQALRYLLQFIHFCQLTVLLLLSSLSESMRRKKWICKVSKQEKWKLLLKVSRDCLRNNYYWYIYIIIIYIYIILKLEYWSAVYHKALFMDRSFFYLWKWSFPIIIRLLFACLHLYFLPTWGC